jgi:AraC-like DNA-binding protein
MIAVLACPVAAAQLNDVLAGKDAIFARSWTELESSGALPEIRVVLLDPTYGAGIDRRTLVRIGKRYPKLSIVAYTSLDPPSLGALIRLSNIGPFLYDVLIHERDGRQDRVLQVAERASAHEFVAEVLGELEMAIGRLPASVSQTLFDLFARPRRYRTVQDIASESHVGVQTLYRIFDAAGLGTPRKMLTIAKLCRGYFLLRTSCVSVRTVAATLGYTRVSTFAENCREIFAIKPSKLRSVKHERELSMKVLDWLCKPRRNKQRRNQISHDGHAIVARKLRGGTHRTRYPTGAT